MTELRVSGSESPPGQRRVGRERATKGDCGGESGQRGNCGLLKYEAGRSLDA